MTPTGQMEVRLIMKTVALVALLALAGVSAADAQTGDTDWKQYGAADFGKNGGLLVMFFDAAGLIHRSNGHVEVWTKGLSRKAIDRALSASSPMHKKIFDVAEHRITAMDRPLLSTIVELDKYQMADVLMNEVAANVANIDATERIMYELDCPNRMVRELSGMFVLDGKPGSQDTPQEWKHISPETAVATLFKLICGQH
jgi:hypothetical protein